MATRWLGRSAVEEAGLRRLSDPAADNNEGPGRYDKSHPLLHRVAQPTSTKPVAVRPSELMNPSAETEKAVDDPITTDLNDVDVSSVSFSRMLMGNKSESSLLLNDEEPSFLAVGMEESFFANQSSRKAKMEFTVMEKTVVSETRENVIESDYTAPNVSSDLRLYTNGSDSGTQNTVLSQVDAEKRREKLQGTINPNKECDIEPLIDYQHAPELENVPEQITHKSVLTTLESSLNNVILKAIRNRRSSLAVNRSLPNAKLSPSRDEDNPQSTERMIATQRSPSSNLNLSLSDQVLERVTPDLEEIRENDTGHGKAIVIPLQANTIAKQASSITLPTLPVISLSGPKIGCSKVPLSRPAHILSRNHPAHARLSMAIPIIEGSEAQQLNTKNEYELSNSHSISSVHLPESSNNGPNMVNDDNVVNNSDDEADSFGDLRISGQMTSTPAPLLKFLSSSKETNSSSSSSLPVRSKASSFETEVGVVRHAWALDTLIEVSDESQSNNSQLCIHQECVESSVRRESSFFQRNSTSNAIETSSMEGMRISLPTSQFRSSTSSQPFRGDDTALQGLQDASSTQEVTHEGSSLQTKRPFLPPTSSRQPILPGGATIRLVPSHPSNDVTAGVIQPHQLPHQSSSHFMRSTVTSVAKLDALKSSNRQKHSQTRPAKKVRLTATKDKPASLTTTSIQHHPTLTLPKDFNFNLKAEAREAERRKRVLEREKSRAERLEGARRDLQLGDQQDLLHCKATKKRAIGALVAVGESVNHGGAGNEISHLHSPIQLTKEVLETSANSFRLETRRRISTYLDSVLIEDDIDNDGRPQSMSSISGPASGIAKNLEGRDAMEQAPSVSAAVEAIVKTHSLPKVKTDRLAVSVPPKDLLTRAPTAARRPLGRTKSHNQRVPLTGNSSGKQLEAGEAVTVLPKGHGTLSTKVQPFTFRTANRSHVVEKDEKENTVQPEAPKVWQPSLKKDGLEERQENERPMSPAFSASLKQWQKRESLACSSALGSVRGLDNVDDENVEEAPRKRMRRSLAEEEQALNTKPAPPTPVLVFDRVQWEIRQKAREAETKRLKAQQRALQAEQERVRLQLLRHSLAAVRPTHLR